MVLKKTLHILLTHINPVDHKVNQHVGLYQGSTALLSGQETGGFSGAVRDSVSYCQRPSIDDLPLFSSPLICSPLPTSKHYLQSCSSPCQCMILLFIHTTRGGRSCSHPCDVEENGMGRKRIVQTK
jgi:hypothetical protein